MWKLIWKLIKWEILSVQGFFYFLKLSIGRAYCVAFAQAALVDQSILPAPCNVAT